MVLGILANAIRHKKKLGLKMKWQTRPHSTFKSNWAYDSQAKINSFLYTSTNQLGSVIEKETQPLKYIGINLTPQMVKIFMKKTIKIYWTA